LAPDNEETNNDQFTVKVNGENQNLSKTDARRELLWSLRKEESGMLMNLIKDMGGFTEEDVLYFRKKGLNGSEEDREDAAAILEAMYW
jgi:hypothetical protein